MESDSTLNIHIPETENGGNLESELQDEPIDASADFIRQEQVSWDSIVEPYRDYLIDANTSEETENQTGQLKLSNFLHADNSENDSTQFEEVVLDCAAPPDLAIEAVNLGITISQDVSAGVVATYLCEKLRERGVSTILLPQSSEEGDEPAESKEVAVNEEELKSVIDEKLSETDDE